jgi:hypothetical protein
MPNYNRLHETQTQRIWAYLTKPEKKRLLIRLSAMELTISEFTRSLIIQFLTTPMPEEYSNAMKPTEENTPEEKGGEKTMNNLKVFKEIDHSKICI